MKKKEKEIINEQFFSEILLKIASVFRFILSKKEFLNLQMQKVRILNFLKLILLTRKLNIS